MTNFSSVLIGRDREFLEIREHLYFVVSIEDAFRLVIQVNTSIVLFLLLYWMPRRIKHFTLW